MDGAQIPALMIQENTVTMKYTVAPLRRRMMAAGLMMAALTLAGCSNESKDAKAPAAAQKLVIKVGHAANEANTGHKGLVQMNKLLAEKTGGRISLEIYPSSQLGSERELIEALQLGNVGMAFTSSAPIGAFKKEFFALDLPFVFKDRATVYKVLDGEPGEYMLKSLESINIKGLGYWENGFRQLSNSKLPVRTPDDLKGIKMRTMENEVHLATWKELGANPAPLAFGELFTALQQKTFEAQETPINLFRDMKYYEVQKFITKTGHLYSPFVVMMSKPLFDGLADADKAALMAAFAEAKTYQRDLAQKADAEAEAEMKTMTFVELSDAEKEAFRAKMGPVYELVKKKAGAEMVEKVLAAVQ